MPTKYTKNEKTGLYSTLVWDGTYDKYGRKHRKQITSKKSSADLERKVNDFKKAVEEKAATYSGDTSFGRYAEYWLQVHKAAREFNTKKMYSIIVRNHFDLIYDVPLSKIRHSHFQEVINEQINHPRTAQQIALTFKQIIKSAVKDRYLPQNALDDILTDISLPAYKKPDKRPLTPLEKEAFFNADLDDRKRAFLNILYYTGLRRGEALALTTYSFDFGENVLSVSDVIVFDGNRPILKPYPKSENGKRTVPIPSACREQLHAYIETLDAGEYLFHTEYNGLMTSTGYRRLWDSILCEMNKAAGYDPQAKSGDAHEKKIANLTAHVFRHNYCTELCYQIPAISTKMIARLLGDREKMVLDVYGHIQEERENLTGAIENAFNHTKSDGFPLTKI